MTARKPSLQVLGDETRPSAEKNLLVSIIKRALFDYFGGSETERQEAREWLFSEIKGEPPFSFPWICAHLRIEPTDILNSIGAMKPKNDTRTQEWWASDKQAA